MPFPLERPRRLRQNAVLRSMVRETSLRPDQLIAPLFVKEGIREKTAILSMPGVFQLSEKELIKEASELWEKGIKAVLLFGIPEKKDARGSASYKTDGLIQKSIRELKNKNPKLVVITDVCLCSSMDHGHCGIIGKNGEIENDASLELLAQMALSHAECGADMVSPSDMMDGRVAMIRKTLDQNHFQNTLIMSYAVKYASSFYGPFREAAESPPQFGDRKTYQMDFANSREALRETKLDEEEGADILMIKPALLSLDVIAAVKKQTTLPVAAYQVSGEYSMICAAAEKGWLDKKQAALESLTTIKRAGADMIVTYFARELMECL